MCYINKLALPYLCYILNPLISSKHVTGSYLYYVDTKTVLLTKHSHMCQQRTLTCVKISDKDKNNNYKQCTNIII